MYNNVAGTGGRKINRCNGDVAGDTGRRCNGNGVAGDTGRRRCDFVYECLEELLEEVLGERNRRRCDCEFVFECLEELLEDVLGESDNNHRCRCHHHNNND
jgi:hypothetical protein